MCFKQNKWEKAKLCDRHWVSGKPNREKNIKLWVPEQSFGLHVPPSGVPGWWPWPHGFAGSSYNVTLTAGALTSAKGVDARGCISWRSGVVLTWAMDTLIFDPGSCLLQRQKH